MIVGCLCVAPVELPLSIAEESLHHFALTNTSHLLLEPKLSNSWITAWNQDCQWDDGVLTNRHSLPKVQGTSSEFYTPMARQETTPTCYLKGRVKVD